MAYLTSVLALHCRSRGDTKFAPPTDALFPRPLGREISPKKVAH